MLGTRRSSTEVMGAGIFPKTLDGCVGMPPLPKILKDTKEGVMDNANN